MNSLEKKHSIGIDLGSSSVKMTIINLINGESIDTVTFPQKEMKFPTNGLFVDSIGAFIILGILIWIHGALSFTFTDSFWFSAVEAEVYAMSSFFTAFVFWAILKWEGLENKKLENK